MMPPVAYNYILRRILKEWIIPFTVNIQRKRGLRCEKMDMSGSGYIYDVLYIRLWKRRAGG